jgi:hypothetical protein
MKRLRESNPRYRGFRCHACLTMTPAWPVEAIPDVDRRSAS